MGLYFLPLPESASLSLRAVRGWPAGWERAVPSGNLTTGKLHQLRGYRMRQGGLWQWAAQSKRQPTYTELEIGGRKWPGQGKCRPTTPLGLMPGTRILTQKTCDSVCILRLEKGQTGSPRNCGTLPSQYGSQGNYLSPVVSSRKRRCRLPTITLSKPSRNFQPTRSSCLPTCHACPWASGKNK